MINFLIRRFKKFKNIRRVCKIENTKFKNQDVKKQEFRRKSGFLIEIEFPDF